MAKLEIFYHYRGPMEVFRARKRRYEWIDGYSEDGRDGGALCPWFSRAECRADARVRGGRAVLCRGGVRE